MLGFLRRRRDGGAQALGEAVTGIPAAPRLPVVPAAPEGVAPVAPVLPPVPAPPALPEAALAPVPVPVVPTPRAAGPGRVELGFRDGTTAVLEPSSAQARELRDLADLLRGAR